MKRLIGGSQTGISLLEILISLGIIIIVIFVVFGIYPNSFNFTTTGINIQAIFLAQEKMDELLSGNSLVSANVRTDYPPTIPREKNNNPTGYRKWWSEPDPHGMKDIQIVKVEVVWTEQKRVKRYQIISALSP